MLEASERERECLERRGRRNRKQQYYFIQHSSPFCVCHLFTTFFIRKRYYPKNHQNVYITLKYMKDRKAGFDKVPKNIYNIHVPAVLVK
jgi:hypothetical protein